MANEGSDFKGFLLPWFNEIKKGGGIVTLKNQIGDYNVFYMFFFTLLTYLPLKPVVSIKIFSIIFDYVLALGGAIVIFRYFKEHKNRVVYSLVTFCTIIMLPTAILNSAMWAQCDSIYTAFIILCLGALLKDKYTLGFVFFSIALCFKLQALFFMPVLFILYFSRRKFSFLNFLIIPAVMWLSALPAIIMGRPIFDVFRIYLNQTKSYKSLMMGNVNIFNLLPDNYEIFAFIGIIFALLAFGSMAFYIVYKGCKIDNSTLISLSLWSVLTCVLFLPSMHERYTFAADILSILYFLTKRRMAIIPIGVNFVSFMTYMNFLYGSRPVPFIVLSVIALFIFALLTYDLIKELKTKKEHWKDAPAVKKINPIDPEQPKTTKKTLKVPQLLEKIRRGIGGSAKTNVNPPL